MSISINSGFYDMMDLLVKWQRHENGEPFDPFPPIIVTKDYERSNQNSKWAVVVGHIADHDVEQFMSHKHAPTDQQFLDEMATYFELQGSGMDYKYVGPVGAASTDAELVSAMRDLEAECRSKYPNAQIRFDYPQTSSSGSSGSKSSGGGCYIATAVYGSYDCPEVWTLRRYRDEKLLQSTFGRMFVKAYYATSPTVVKLFGKTEWFNKFWRGRLNKMVDNLKAEGYEDTPYYDR